MAIFESIKFYSTWRGNQAPTRQSRAQLVESLPTSEDYDICQSIVACT